MIYKHKAEDVMKNITSLLPHMTYDDALFEMRNSFLSTEMMNMIGTLLGNYLGLEFLGAGCTRICLKLDDNSVIKVYLGADDSEFIESQHYTEIINILYATDKGCPYVPKLYYFDDDCIILEYLPTENDFPVNIANPYKEVLDIGFTTIDKEDSVSDRNWGCDFKGNPKMLDWGTMRISDVDMLKTYCEKYRQFKGVDFSKIHKF